ncbi:hypothetical protein CANARDRAFT_159875 [[Candida] arabinofermentans NRRL YB-2248]|uniref:DNA-(apurinic or apyrimidinic site) lyase n=1 Tax=[Candida] arabinofermentans NRRL YB-2248 TaxID=983967 RepID=A0A1E4T067_9ASCO|nr:hypothetical protein CANARDRAFT_159875 [[Candida] arabinofermentans NRRL YB-2248]
MTQDLIWKSIKIAPTELTLSKVLRCGQAFRWKFIDGIWSCSIGDQVILLKQDDVQVQYSSIPTSPNTLKLLTNYFNLQVNFGELYDEWCKMDTRFIKNSKNFQGVRMLNQDPWENLISFICSTNNNVKRISKMCENLCINYGTYIATYQDQKHYTFPTPSKLSQPEIESELRSLGFGYRAKFIQQTALLLSDKSEFSKLYSMRTEPHKITHQYLQKFTGVGPKVADCVSLMSLQKHDVVPIDTHVFKIATKDYKFSCKSKTLNKELYSEIQTFFKNLWGDYAGWAHSVLFAADLKDLNNGVNSTADKVILKIERDSKAELKLEPHNDILQEESSIIELKLEEQDIKLEEEEEKIKVLSESQIRRMKRYQDRSKIRF